MRWISIKLRRNTKLHLKTFFLSMYNVCHFNLLLLFILFHVSLGNPSTVLPWFNIEEASLQWNFWLTIVSSYANSKFLTFEFFIMNHYSVQFSHKWWWYYPPHIVIKLFIVVVPEIFKFDATLTSFSAVKSIFSGTTAIRAVFANNLFPFGFRIQRVFILLFGNG